MTPYTHQGVSLEERRHRNEQSNASSGAWLLVDIFQAAVATWKFYARMSQRPIACVPEG